MSENISSADPQLTGCVRSLLDGMAEPVALLSPGGVIRYHNPAFRILCAAPVQGRMLTDISEGDAESLQTFLHRASGTSSPLLGTLMLASRKGARHRVQARRVQLGTTGPMVLIQLDAGAEQRFEALSRKVAELDRDIAQRRHAEAVLQESLRERELLLRELQHRVKNNLQMLGRLLRRAERETASEEARAALRDVSARLSAIHAVQRLLYGSTTPAAINSRLLIDDVAAGAVALAPHEVDWRVDSIALAFQIDAATSLALVLNELVTNAIKHGRPARGKLHIAISLLREGEELMLVVADNGPGFDHQQDPETNSGLDLVAGITGQLGGSTVIDTREGARFTIRFPLAAFCH